VVLAGETVHELGSTAAAESKPKLEPAFRSVIEEIAAGQHIAPDNAVVSISTGEISASNGIYRMERHRRLLTNT
jgi:hypothetical protein